MGLALAAGVTAATPASAAAQYFGRNKVQYETFNFRVMHTEHFDLYYYPPESLVTADAARMVERWYSRHRELLRADFQRRSIILYADAPDFQQTNVIGGFISQGTGGVTEALRSRVVLPFTGVYADEDHVIGHELVHVFQYDIAAAAKGGLNSMNQLPLWVIEGMAEYLSLGRDDPNTAMWLRDAVLRNDVPTIKKLNTDPRYFPYRYGEALWAYIGGRWGDEAINTLYRASLQSGWDGALRRVLGVSSDTLSAQWAAALRATYAPAMAGRQTPDQTGVRLLRPASRQFGDMDVAPQLSPDGRYVAFFTTRGLFTTDLYVADAETGRIVKKLTSPNTDSHFDAISFISSTGSWSPDGKKFAFIVYADGDQEIAIFDVASKRTERRLHFAPVGAINDVSWSPDGRRLVFSGLKGGISDLYLYDLGTGRLEQLTNDKYADLQPTWSPDGQSIAWSTDRGPGTDFDRLAYGPMRLAVMDLASRQIRVLPLPFTGKVKAINPQYSPDGHELYFISDREGFSDIYRLDLASGQLYQVTRSATGVSGITALSPALSVARQSGRLVFSLFERGGYSLHRLDPAEARGQPVAVQGDSIAVAGILPPTDVPGGGAVTLRVNDPTTGLPPAEPRPVTPYRPSLSLEYVGSPGVGIGVATGPYGGVVAGGGVAAYFSDLLGNQVVGAQIAGGGDIRNFGGQLIYQNLSHRWNWGAGLSHSPYIAGFATISDTVVDIGGGQQVLGQAIDQIIQRTYYDQALVMTQYPFSMTRRFELSGGFTHVGYGLEIDRFLVIGNQVFALPRGSGQTPPSVNYGQVSAALVGDYSYFGFTSPIAGGRYRFEVTPIFGGLVLQNVLADYRRYLYARPFTFAVRAIHVGRYGRDAEDQRLFPLYVGDPLLVRGYEATSFDGGECGGAAAQGDCPVFDRLLGSRVAVANAEIRFPLLGTEGLGLINFPYLATEIAPFFDAGVAWTSEESPNLEFARNTARRVPVFSTGVSARVNLLGYAVLEFYYAYPFQRPLKGGHFGFQIAPGW